jgi:hypothetical protein
MTDPLDDHQHANVRQAYEDALDAVPTPIRDRHATLAGMVKEMADWPHEAIGAIEAERDDGERAGAYGVWPVVDAYVDGLEFALEAVRNVGA